MWAFTDETSFPAHIKLPASHINLLDKFFEVVDRLTPEPDAGEEFKDVFTSDGVWKTPFATYTGMAELQKSGHLWTDLRKRKSMRHWVKQIYVNDAEGNELMMIGRIRVEVNDDDVRDVNFGAQMVIENGSKGVNGNDNVNGHGGSARLKFFQGWSSAQ